MPVRSNNSGDSRCYIAHEALGIEQYLLSYIGSKSWETSNESHITIGLLPFISIELKLLQRYTHYCV